MQIVRSPTHAVFLIVLVAGFSVFVRLLIQSPEWKAGLTEMHSAREPSSTERTSAYSKSWTDV